MPASRFVIQMLLNQRSPEAQSLGKDKLMSLRLLVVPIRDQPDFNRRLATYHKL